MVVAKLELSEENCGCGCESTAVETVESGCGCESTVEVKDNGCDNPKCTCDPCSCPPPCCCGE